MGHLQNKNKKNLFLTLTHLFFFHRSSLPLTSSTSFHSASTLFSTPSSVSQHCFILTVDYTLKYIFLNVDYDICCVLTATFDTTQITVTEEPDTLFQRISVLVKGHDRAVLDSYEFFATMAAKELGITVSKVWVITVKIPLSYLHARHWKWLLFLFFKLHHRSEPLKDIERLTLLKSVHIFKKHRVQYEMRTHYRCFEVCGSGIVMCKDFLHANQIFHMHPPTQTSLANIC